MSVGWSREVTQGTIDQANRRRPGVPAMVTMKIPLRRAIEITPGF
jgi:hypothetical protein